MRQFILFVGLAYLLMLDSPGTSASRARGFDVNDVTVLLPLDEKDQPFPSIELDSALVSDGVFSSLMIEATEQWISAPAGSSILKREGWRLVGFRYDPCAPTDTQGEDICVQELRLVAQSMGSFGPSDSSLHLIYRIDLGLPHAEDALLAELFALKDRGSEFTAGEPLSVHPLLQKAMTEGDDATASAFASFVRRHAKASRLQKLTMMGLRDGSPIDWIFLGGKIEGGRWTPMTVPNLGNGGRTFVELNLGGGAEVFSPRSTDLSLSMENFFNHNVEGVNANLEGLDRGSHTIENPGLSNRLTVDCVSCHSATSVRLTGQFSFSPFIKDLTASVPLRITGFPGPQMLTSHPAHWNLRALGYFGLQASITMRTVHESARVAEQLNEIMGLTPPGRDCSQVEREVMACFVNSSRLFGTVLPKESCLKSCQH